MGIKERIDKLERSMPEEAKKVLLIYILAGVRHYTPEELAEAKKTVIWTRPVAAIFWNGERFGGKGGSDQTPIPTHGEDTVEMGIYSEHTADMLQELANREGGQNEQ
jgi:hypothetical protein